MNQNKYWEFIRLQE